LMFSIRPGVEMIERWTKTTTLSPKQYCATITNTFFHSTKTILCYQTGILPR